MKILYLNFASPEDNATNNTIPRLLKKYQRRDESSRMDRFSAYWWGASVVERVDCFAAVAEQERYLKTPLGEDPGGLEAYEAARNQVRTFFLRHPHCEKIMVGMHGQYDDVDYGYSLPSHDSPKVSYLKAADLVLSLLRDHVGTRSLKMSLVMCYGARSAQYDQSHDPDRLGVARGPDLATSFAFKFYTALCKHLNLKLSARTGAASFDDTTGASRVESELTLHHRIQMARNPFTPEERDALDDHSQLEMAAFMEDLQPQADNAFDMAQVREADRRGDAFAKAQLTTLEGDDPLTRAKREAAWSRYSQLPESKPKKSGKLTYEYDAGSHQVTIKCKYPQPRVVQRVNV